MTDKIKHTPGPWGILLIAAAHVVGPNNRGNAVAVLCGEGGIGYQAPVDGSGAGETG